MYKLNLLLSLMILCLIYSSFAIGQDVNAQLTDYSRISINISVPKDTFLLLEPIPLKFSVKNESGIKVMGRADIGRLNRDYKLYIERPDGVIINPKKITLVETCVNCQTNYIDANKSFEKIHLIEDYFVQKLFHKEGKYKMWAEICNTKCGETNAKLKKSNKITFSIKKPSERNFKAYNEVKKLSELKLKDYKKYISLAENFVIQYPDNPYINYVLYELGLYSYGLGRKSQSLQYFLSISLDFVYSEDIFKKVNSLSNTEN